jgi:hypothetical protein
MTSIKYLCCARISSTLAFVVGIAPTNFKTHSAVDKSGIHIWCPLKGLALWPSHAIEESWAAYLKIASSSKYGDQGRITKNPSGCCIHATVHLPMLVAATLNAVNVPTFLPAAICMIINLETNVVFPTPAAPNIGSTPHGTRLTKSLTCAR